MRNARKFPACPKSDPLMRWSTYSVFFQASHKMCLTFQIVCPPKQLSGSNDRKQRAFFWCKKSSFSIPLHASKNHFSRHSKFQNPTLQSNPTCTYLCLLDTTLRCSLYSLYKYTYASIELFVHSQEDHSYHIVLSVT